MRVLGLDLSLAAPGVAYNGKPRTLPASNYRGPALLSHRAGQLLSLLDYLKPDLVVIEGYAISRNLAGARSLAELGGVVRFIFHEREIAFVEVPPSTLKKYATGKGNADKHEVIRAALEAGAQLPHRRKPPQARPWPYFETRPPIGREWDDNAADAWWLYQMGLAKFAPSMAVPREDRNNETLDVVEWPNMRRGKK